MVFQFDLSITKRNYLFVAKTSVFVPYTSHFFAMFKSAIMEVELDDGGKHSKTTNGGKLKAIKRVI